VAYAHLKGGFVTFRIFKENALVDDERTASSLKDAVAIYDQYFAAGYTVRVADVDSGIEYAMYNGKLAPIPYSRAKAQAASK
jgi:hypothetical protein